MGCAGGGSDYAGRGAAEDQEAEAGDVKTWWHGCNVIVLYGAPRLIGGAVTGLGQIDETY